MAAARPLTYANVISFFKETNLRPTEVQKRCTVFFEGEWRSANVYDYCLIIVENSDEDVQVTFYLTECARNALANGVSRCAVLCSSKNTETFRPRQFRTWCHEAENRPVPCGFSQMGTAPRANPRVQFHAALSCVANFLFGGRSENSNYPNT